jgi:hypothetical protein
MILSIYAEKVLGKVSYPFMVKAVKRLGIERMFLNVIEVIYDKPRARIILNEEQLKPFPVKS